MPSKVGGDCLTAEEREGIEAVLQPFQIDHAKLSAFMDKFEEDLNKGLSKTQNFHADMKCFPTYVSSLPTGEERGHFLALDLGGTHFRVLLIHLAEGDRKEEIEFKTFDVPEHLMVGSVLDLFDYIATCISDFVIAAGLQDHDLALGFTFSFSCEHKSLRKAKLKQWSKGYKCEDGVDKDVGRLLMEAIYRRDNLRVSCVAVINDTTGTLMSCAYEDKDTCVGLIMGTGTNACYLERIEKAELWSAAQSAPTHLFGVINTEWCAFGDGGVLDILGIRNDYDRFLDATTNNVGYHRFEKMVSGKYLGEIVRLVLCELFSLGLIFHHQDSEYIHKTSSLGRMKFYTKFLSDIEGDDSPNMLRTRQALDQIGIRNPTLKDCQIVKLVCQRISFRSATLTGAGVACLLRRVGRPRMTVAVDGSYSTRPSASVSNRQSNLYYRQT